MCRILEERDVIFAELETTLQKTRESLAKIIVGMLKRVKAPITKYKCSICGYQIKTNSGLSMHAYE